MLRIKMREADTGCIDLNGLKVFWRELFMIFCHVFWLTEIYGQSFNEAQWISKISMADKKINVKHFKSIHKNRMLAIISTI